MNFELINIANTSIAKLISDQVEIASVQDGLDLIANAQYHSASCIVVMEHHLASSFFELKTQVAGEILQKCKNYNTRLAIVGEFEKYHSKSLNDFIKECNRGSDFFFTSDENAAIEFFLN